jgi:integrase
MSVQRLPGGRYKVRWRDASGTHHGKTFEKGEYQLATALDEEMKRARRLGHVSHLVGSKVTIGEAAADWWANRGSQKAPRTVKHYHQLLHSHVLPTWDAVPIRGVTVGDVESWLAKLQTGPTAKRQALGILNQVFNYGIRQEWTQMNPCSLADKPRLPEKEPIIPPTPLEVERIRAELFNRDRPGDAYLVSLLAYAGPRPNEAWRLTWADIQDRTILLRASKTGRPRTVPMLGPLASDLAQWKLSGGSQNLLVFPTTTGKQFNKDTWDNWRNRVWDKVAAAITPYSLRHTYVSLMIRDPEVSRPELAKWAGHGLDVQDKHYAHVFAELEGTGSAEDAIREARAEVFGQPDKAADAQTGGHDVP